MSENVVKMKCIWQAAAVFAEASWQSGRAGQIWEGDKVEVLEFFEDWARIRHPSGWVRPESLERCEDSRVNGKRNE